MPSWSIEYPTLLADDRIQLYTELELIRSDSALGTCEVTDSPDNPVTVVTASFLGFGPNDPRVAELIRRKGILHTPVNIWLPLQVSRIVPNGRGGHDIVRDNPTRLSGGGTRDQTG